MQKQPTTELDNFQENQKVKVERTRLDFVDLLKAIAIYCVLMYHFPISKFDFLSAATVENYLGYYIEALFSTSVPIFFFVNGGLLLTKKTLNIKNHLIKTVQLIALTMVWGVITILVLALARGETVSVKMILGTIYMLKEHWVDHLWFLEALAVLYIFFPLIFAAFKNYRPYIYFFLGAVVLFTSFNHLLGMTATLVSMVTDIISFNDLTAFNFFSRFNPFASLMGGSFAYFILGGLFFENLARFQTRKAKLMALLALIISTLILFLFGIQVSFLQGEVWDIAWNSGESIFTMVNVVCIFILCLSYKAKAWYGKLIRLLGDYSLSIYLIHIIVATFFYSYFKLGGLFGELIFGLMILLVSLGIGILISKAPVLRNIVSMGSNKKSK